MVDHLIFTNYYKIKMYRRPKFLEILLEIREQMSRDADFDVDLFAEMVRSGKILDSSREYQMKTIQKRKKQKK